MTRPHYWQRRPCRAAFTVVMGTPLEGTHLTMRTWFTALYLVAASSKGMLAAEKAEYTAAKRFLWRKQLQPMAVAMRREPGLEWLSELPAHAVLDCVARLDGAPRRMVSVRKAGRKCGFPKPKKKFVREAGIYCVAQASTVDGQQAILPKLGRVKLSGGDVPQGRLLASCVWRDDDRWMLSAQFECARPEPILPTGVTLGGDLGVSTLMTTYDGAEFEEVLAPKPLRKAQRRLKRAQRKLSRRQKGSARRRAQGRRVGVIHRKVRCIRQDALHQTSHRLTAKADVLKLETLNVAGMARNHRIALSIADAGMGRLVTFIQYKANWRGREVVQIDPWFPGSQTCCLCDAPQGDEEPLGAHHALRLRQRHGPRQERRRQPLQVPRGAGEPGSCPYARGDRRSG